MEPIDEPLRTALAGRVLVITGSGVSAESGVPTFRGNAGYWRTHRAEELATPGAFNRDPLTVWTWYRERRAAINAAKPNVAHVAMVALAESCREFLLVTQNVDDLHERAVFQGRTLPKSKRVHIHGEIFVSRCCRCEYATEDRADTPPDTVPTCPKCNSFLRPGVVWFGEGLPEGETERVSRFLADGECDAVIVIGTTAIFPYITGWAIQARGKNGILVEVNPTETRLSANADRVFRATAGAVLPRMVP
jgi:NAD-dependent deacetylase